MRAKPMMTVEFEKRYYRFNLNENEETQQLSGNIKSSFYIPGYLSGSIELKNKLDSEGRISALELSSKEETSLWELRKEPICIYDALKLRYWDTFDETVGIYLGTEESVSFGSSGQNRVILKRSGAERAFILIKVDDNWVLRAASSGVYLNGTAAEGITSLELGDVIEHQSYRLIFGADHLVFYHHYAYDFVDIVVYSEIMNKGKRDYPNFKRTPRNSYALPEESIVIPKIPSKSKADKTGLIMRIVPTLGMVAMTVTVGLLMGRGLMTFASAGMAAITLIISVISFFRDRTANQKEDEEKAAHYEKTIDAVRGKIRSNMGEQRGILIENNPSQPELIARATEFSPRLWERSPEQNDFLHVRLGTGDVALSFSVDYAFTDDKDIEKDELHQKALALSKKYRDIRSVPLEVDLSVGITAVIGKREFTMPHTLSIIAGLSVTHSYRDLGMVIISCEEQYNMLLPLKWLPHTWVGDRQFKAIVHDSRTRDNILGSLLQVFKERKQSALEERSKKIKYAPMLFVIFDIAIIMDHEMMEFLSEDYRALGIFTIFVTENKDLLPAATKNILEVKRKETAAIIREDGIDKKKTYKPDYFTKENLEKVARALAPINHVEASESEMPKSVTLFEMYGVKNPEEFSSTSRWNKNKAYKTLAVPIGLRGVDNIIELNLHEKAHGPHGLVAGTTGSGKSETIQTYIVSLALNFHPYSIAFLLIDYKGGGMANLFADLPHLLGTITNLDGAQTMRALVAIKSELRRRQEVFSKHDVNHIDQYQKLFEEGVAKEPMPHLFIISDEFAELKNEKPEFIRELVSAARIGRSLGIHLILATQKPSGVVDDQIWSNSKFRICLKVQNASDSNEMIKTPDAASLTDAGRGYLQVGNNEIYELFQSAYSGASYHKSDGGDEDVADTNIYLFNDLGQTQLLTQDFSLNTNDKKESEKVSELSAVVSYLEDEFLALNIPNVKKPWLPPLEERVYLPDLKSKKLAGFTATIGTLDQPQLQRQGNFVIDFSGDGHAIVFGSSGMGKSTYLRTLALSIASKYTAEEAQFYLIDFGSNALLSLRGLPHTADVITLDDTAKLSKLLRILGREIKRRKELLGSAGVSTMDIYCKLKKKTEPNIVIFVDNMDPVKEQIMEEFEKTLALITREGQALGVYAVMSASRPGAVRFSLISNIKNQSALYMIDKSETYTAVGRSELESEALAGRGLAKIDGEVCAFQIALPTKSESDEAAVVDFNTAISQIDKSYKGKRPLPIPILPEVILSKEYYKNNSVKAMLKRKAPIFPIGFDDENVESYGLDFGKISHYNIVGGVSSGKSGVVRSILSSAEKKYKDAKFIIFDNSMMKYIDMQDNENTVVYASAKEEMEAGLTATEAEIEVRKSAFLGEISKGGKRIAPIDFYASFPKWFVLINTLNQFTEKLGAALQARMDVIYENTKQMGIHIIISSNAGDYAKSFDVFTKAVKTCEDGFLMVQSDKQQIWNLGYAMSKLAPLLPGEGYDIRNGVFTRVKTPLFED